MRTQLFFLIAALLFSTSGSQVGSEDAEDFKQDVGTIVAMVEMKAGKLSYTIDSKSVLPKDLLAAFFSLVERKGEDSTVVVIVDVRAPISQYGIVYGFAAKAGFTRVRNFVFNAERQSMSELKFGPSIPFSLNPPLG